MGITTAREFDQDASAAMRSAAVEPLIITDHGVPSFVLLTYAEYERLTRQQNRMASTCPL